MTQDTNHYGSGRGFGRAVRVIAADEQKITHPRIFKPNDNHTLPWELHPQHPISSFDSYAGYKIKHTEYHQQAIAHIRGEICPNTPITLNPYPEDNWVGYWLLNSQSILSAFGTQLDDILEIETHKMYFKNHQRRPAVLREGFLSSLVEFGQIANIKLKSHIQEPLVFSWINSRIPGESDPALSDPLPEQELQHFFFEQTSEYQVFDIEYIEDTLGAVEIGIFAKGVCLGAAVYDEDPVQILFYPQGFESEDIEIRFWDGVSEYPSTLDIEIWDFNEEEWLDYTPAAGDWKYSLIQLTGIQEPPQESESALRGGSSHPNPFNPDVTISFALIERSDLDISIFNIKGQKVKNLASGRYEAGNYNMVWNGRNDNNQPVGSGVYFYRIVAGSETVQGKMLMLK